MATPDVPQLRRLEAVDAFKLAVEESGLSLPEIAKGMDWSMPQARRVFSAEQYFPSFPDLPRFCAVVGNLTVVHWLLAKATFYGVDEQHQSLDCADLLLRVTEIFSDVGTVAEEARKAVADNKLEACELRRLIRELSELLACGMALVGDLRLMERATDA